MWRQEYHTCTFFCRRMLFNEAKGHSKSTRNSREIWITVNCSHHDVSLHYLNKNSWTSWSTCSSIYLFAKRGTTKQSLNMLLFLRISLLVCHLHMSNNMACICKHSEALTNTRPTHLVLTRQGIISCNHLHEILLPK